jgi:hypothetical protein
MSEPVSYRDVLLSEPKSSNQIKSKKDIDDLLEVVISDSYGGYELSQEAKDLLKKRDNKNEYRGHRHDPILVSVVKELGEKSWTKYSRPIVINIPRKYKNYYAISEYDGREDIVIKYDLFKLDHVKLNMKMISDILGTSSNSDEKIAKISEIMTKYHEDLKDDQDSDQDSDA